MIISYTHELPMGHRLQYHDGKCRYLHGHNYVVTVFLEGSIAPGTGFVIDYSVLKAATKAVLDQYDHAFALQDNDPAAAQIGNFAMLKLMHTPPTAENLALLWRGEIETRLLLQPHERLQVEVKETSSTSARTQYSET